MWKDFDSAWNDGGTRCLSRLCLSISKRLTIDASTGVWNLGRESAKQVSRVKRTPLPRKHPSGPDQSGPRAGPPTSSAPKNGSRGLPSYAIQIRCPGPAHTILRTVHTQFSIWILVPFCTRKKHGMKKRGAPSISHSLGSPFCIRREHPSGRRLGCFSPETWFLGLKDLRRWPRTIRARQRAAFSFVLCFRKESS